MSVAVVRYFVSQQHGNDSNTGLSEAQAWATLTKAAQTVQTPAAGDCHIIHWGPGTYREKLTFSYAGRSSTEYIQYAPDPNCLYLTNDKPGRCRITGCDSNEIMSSGAVVSWNSKNYVTFGCYESDCYVDGTTGDVMAAGLGTDRTSIRVHVKAAYARGFFEGTHINCTSQSASVAFYNGTNINCIAFGHNYGYERGTCINCMAVGGGNIGGFYSTECTNCIAQACLRGYYSCRAFNCTAVACCSGFQGQTTVLMSVYGCKVAGCQNALGSYIDGDGTVVEDSAIVGHIGQMPFMPTGIRQRGWWARDTYNDGLLGATLALTSERLITFTPSATGTSKGVAIYIEAAAATGSVTCELQKKVNTVWVTQRSKTIPVSGLSNLVLNRFEWDTGTGDDQLTRASSTWRYRITADEDAQSTTIRTSNDVALTYHGYAWPDSMPTTDITGRPRCEHGAYPSIGPWEPPDMKVDWEDYAFTAPGIKLTGNSMHIMQVPAAANKAITIKWRALHHGTGADMKPQIILRGPGVTEQVATCTAAADTWQEISVSMTPVVDCVLDCCLYARDPATGAYSVFSDPNVG